jgi:hypothetical protein
MRDFAIMIFSALAIVVLVDAAFYEGWIWKHAWAQLQSQQTNLQQWKNDVQQRTVNFIPDR